MYFFDFISSLSKNKILNRESFFSYVVLIKYFAKYNLDYLLNIKFFETFINLLISLANLKKILVI